MAEIKLRAIGLREVNFSEHDRYLTALTEDGRKIEILCKQARSKKNRAYAARLFCWSEFILRERSGKYTLREVSLLHSFFALTEDIEKYALACYLADLTNALSVEEEENTALCRLLLGALYRLETGEREPCLIKAAFEWRSMSESGYAPALTRCGLCGRSLNQTPIYFSVYAGQAADAKCAERLGGWDKLENATLYALAHTLTKEPDKIYSFSLTGLAQKQFCSLAEQYVQYHLERTFDTLQFYHTVITPNIQ